MPGQLRKTSNNSLYLSPRSEANGILKTNYIFFVNPKNGLSAMQVNELGFVATILFVFVPSIFLIILYIQTASKQS